MPLYLNALQAIIAVLVIALILLQQRGTALGGTFGGEGGFYGTLRGVQKKIFYATVILVFIFISLAVFRLILA